MEIRAKNQDTLPDYVRSFYTLSYLTAAFAFLFSLISIYVLHITLLIPYFFIGYALLNLTNALYYKWHRTLGISFNIAFILGLFSVSAIALYSGGICSPFLFLLANIVLSAYLFTPALGRIYLMATLGLAFLIFLEDYTNFGLATNLVPLAQRELFGFLSVLSFVFFTGGMLGEVLRKAHYGQSNTIIDLNQRIAEKETLLKEIHHRVKNNLQTVSSLLSLQSRNSEDVNVKNLFKSSQNRVIAMAMVHEMLYMRKDLSKIEYNSYVKELSEYLVRSVKGVENNITLNIDIQDIKLGIDTAIPLGLLINETITNSLKYGIMDDNDGEIHIALKKGDAREYVLNIGDNGVGCPDVLSYKTSKSLGLKLIHNLARQLRGSITRDFSLKGTNYIVKFEEIGQQFHSLT